MPIASERSNAAWSAALGGTGCVRDDAVADLRARLLLALRSALSGRAEAQLEDFAQEAVIRVLDSLREFRGEGPFLAWATAIAIRVAFSELRRARWKDVSLDGLLETSGGPAAAIAMPPPAPSTLDRRAVYAALARSIEAALTDRQRTVILAELRGMPQAVLTDRLRITRNALYKLGHDARRALARDLAAHGFTGTVVRELLAEPTEDR
jgi:RNA polymerase sigma-70 factor (ECF subfamily)